jgi:hypothetical protein
MRKCERKKRKMMDNAKNKRKITIGENKQKGRYIGSKICSANPLIAGKGKLTDKKFAD